MNRNQVLMDTRLFMCMIFITLIVRFVTLSVCGLAAITLSTSAETLKMTKPKPRFLLELGCFLRLTFKT